MRRKVSVNPYREDFDPDDYVKSVKEYCCKSFLEEAQKAIECVRNEVDISPDNYRKLQFLLWNLYCFNKTGDS